MKEPPNHDVEKFLKEFQTSNEKIEPLDLCLCVLADGAHRILPILPRGKFLDGETEVEAVWFCKASSATRLIGQLFSSRENQPDNNKGEYEKTFDKSHGFSRGILPVALGVNKLDTRVQPV